MGYQFTLAQGTLRGKITDETGQAVIGAAVVLKADPGVGTITDFDGIYSLEIKSTEPVVVVISFISYVKQESTVNPKGGEVILRNFSLVPASFDIGEVVIESKANRAGDFYMEKIKQNSATSIDYISSEVIQKIGDRDVSAAVSRVPGVSTVGNFVTVRGLADRYLKTTVNGSRIPTLDPFTNNLNLDIFATGMIDNLVITKTASPDLPGDWSGAYISIETKDYPEKLTVEISTSVGYNPQSTFQNIVSSRGSSTDWLGWDNGYRDVPNGVPITQSEFPVPNFDPDLNQQFQAIGIADDLSVYGITSGTPITSGDDFHRLGLNNLGLLGPAQFYNEQAFNNAVNEYNALYPGSFFFQHYNQDLADIGTSFNNDWFTVTKNAPLNFSQNFSIGNQTKLFGRTLGFLVAFRYSSATQYDGNSVSNRTNREPNFIPTDDATLADEQEFSQKISSETNGWNGLINLAYKLNPNNSFSVLFMPNILGENNARMYQGRTENQNLSETLFGHDQIYEERQQLVYQYRSDHYIPGSKIKIDLNASYTNGTRNALDFKSLSYLYDAANDVFFFPTFADPIRQYRYLDEELLDTRVSVEIPVEKWAGHKAKVKVGGAFQRNERNTTQVEYTVRGVGGLPIDTTLAGLFYQDRFSIDGESNFDLRYSNTSVDLDTDIGISKIAAAFAMVDFNLTPLLRVVGGVRMEQTDILTDIRTYFDRNLPRDDPDRQIVGVVRANPGDINQLDILPSVNLVYKLNSDPQAPVNLRFNYFQSLARPGFRELSSVDLLDFQLQANIAGNSNLKVVNVRNYDLRLESYFKNGDNVSLSLFYKDFTNHIELIKIGGSSNFTWENAPKSQAFGVEVEGKKQLTKHFDIRGNFSFIDSETTVTTPVMKTRRMFGQAPYIVNTTLSYEHDSLGFNASVSYNIQGPKIAAVVNAAVAQPDIIEIPRHVIDVNLNKRFGRHYSVGIRIRNLINAPFRRAYDFDAGYLLDFDNIRWGPVYNLSFTYRL